MGPPIPQGAEHFPRTSQNGPGPAGRHPLFLTRYPPFAAKALCYRDLLRLVNGVAFEIRIAISVCQYFGFGSSGGPTI